MEKKKNTDGKGIKIGLILTAVLCLLLGGCQKKDSYLDSLESASAESNAGQQDRASGWTDDPSGERTGERSDGQVTESKALQNEVKQETALQEIAMSDGLAGEEDPENLAGALQERCGNVNVRIRAGNLIGSGVIYKSDESTVWIATAAHVLEQVENEAEITFRDGYVAKSYAIVRAREQDVAFLKVFREALVDEATGEDHGENYRCALISKDAYDGIQIGDAVIAMGSKSGAGEEAYAGVLLQDYVYLEDFGVYMLLSDVEVKPGMSGGGLFDARGCFLGILCGMAEDGEVAVAPMISLMIMDE